MQNNPIAHLSGYTFHVLIRTADRQKIFFSPSDYIQYLSVIKQNIHKHHCDLHAYVLMPNHIHLLLTPTIGSGLPHLIKHINRQFNMYYAHQHHCQGVAWDRWFRFSLVENTPFILTLYRYLELNPVRSGLTEKTASYPWSSYMGNTHGKSSSLLKAHPQYLALGKDDMERQLRYSALFDVPISDAQEKYIHKSAIRNRILGSDEFVQKMVRQQSWDKFSQRLFSSSRVIQDQQINT